MTTLRSFPTKGSKKKEAKVRAACSLKMVFFKMREQLKPCPDGHDIKQRGGTDDTEERANNSRSMFSSKQEKTGSSI